ncbi:MAG4530 family protein [Mycoplasmopsis felifaucium]|uniref:MAG4530 family protein n=1 Tax=Mycoplasmopsis felifaucium TaxID=35768 RepID=UPI0004866C2E|nr:hypothetical protein [Mycoplasmopsis felifaucium]
MERDINQNFKKIWILISMVLTVFGILFLTLVYILIILPSINNIDSYKLWYLFLHPFTILFYIPLFWVLIISTNYHLYLVYESKNLFKARKYLNRYYAAVCKYKKIVRYPSISINEDNLLWLKRHNFVLRNEAAIQIYFGQIYRSFKKLIFIPANSRTNFKHLNCKISCCSSFQENNSTVVFEHKSIKIEIDNKDLIPKALIKQDNSKILVPNFHWLIAYKFIQIFDHSKTYEKNKNNLDFQEILNNYFTDLAYLLSKKSFSYKKFLFNLKVLTISNSLLRLFQRNDNDLSFYNKTNQENFISMVNELLSENEIGSETLFFADFIFKKLLKDKKYLNLWISMKAINDKFDLYLNNLVDNKIITKFDKKSCFIGILNKSFLSKSLILINYKKPKYIKLLLECFKTEKNEIDIRKLYLIELLKEIDNEKK